MGRVPGWLLELRRLCKLCKLCTDRFSSMSSKVDLNALITLSCKHRILGERGMRKRLLSFAPNLHSSCYPPSLPHPKLPVSCLAPPPQPDTTPKDWLIPIFPKYRTKLKKIKSNSKRQNKIQLKVFEMNSWQRNCEILKNEGNRKDYDTEQLRFYFEYVLHSYSHTPYLLFMRLSASQSEYLEFQIVNKRKTIFLKSL